jgi:hypothetical protein
MAQAWRDHDNRLTQSRMHHARSHVQHTASCATPGCERPKRAEQPRRGGSQQQDSKTVKWWSSAHGWRRAHIAAPAPPPPTHTHV